MFSFGITLFGSGMPFGSSKIYHQLKLDRTGGWSLPMMDSVLILVILSPFAFPAGVLSGAASAEALDSIT
jgi:hypothetical protein